MNYEGLPSDLRGSQCEAVQAKYRGAHLDEQSGAASFVWQIYSHDLEPNSSLFACMKACEPVHIQMIRTTGM